MLLEIAKVDKDKRIRISRRAYRQIIFFIARINGKVLPGYACIQTETANNVFNTN